MSYQCYFPHIVSLGKGDISQSLTQPWLLDIPKRVKSYSPDQYSFKSLQLCQQPCGEQRVNAGTREMEEHSVLGQGEIEMAAGVF